MNIKSKLVEEGQVIKNKLGEELLSDGEVLDILYDWMGRETRNYTLEHKGRKLLAREVLEFLRENEQEEMSNG
tara:strand:+ start:848 stop:1066 length:219 start_codon:yes stop_codon:yes gene_type:complete